MPFYILFFFVLLSLPGVSYRLLISIEDRLNEKCLGDVILVLIISDNAVDDDMSIIIFSVFQLKC